MERNKLIAISAIAITILLALFIRAQGTKFYGFYEPDGFFHYAVLRSAVSNNFTIPTNFSLSGWPTHATLTEPVGLYWTTLLPYFFLRFAGIDYYTVMRFIPMLFAVLDIIGVYYLVRYFNKDRFFGILTAFLIAVNGGNIARTAVAVYRGDGFVSIFIILSLIFLLKTIRTESRNKKIAFAALSGFMLSLCGLIWNGSLALIAVYLFSLLLLLVYGFLSEDLKLLKDLNFTLISLIVLFALTTFYTYLNWIPSQSFTIYFVVFSALLFVALEVVLFITKNRERFTLITGSQYKRLLAVTASSILSILLIYLLMPNFFYQVLVVNGAVITSNKSFESTIAELQPPNPEYLFSSFGPPMFLTPMSILLYNSSFYSAYRSVLYILALLTIATYLFMDTENVDENSFLSGNALIRFRVNDALLIFISYFAITAYLQFNAVRFNSIFSIPFAIFVAYTLYWMVLWSKRNKFMFNTLLFFVFLLSFASAYVGYMSLAVAPQVDFVNPQFVSALSWLKNNTPGNSVVLTTWPDGSVVEGFANRISVTDSVASQKHALAADFSAWLLNSSPDPQFLLSNVSGRPSYLLVRYVWFSELGSIVTESGLNVSPTSYGFAPFSRVAYSQGSNSLIINFSNPPARPSSQLVLTGNATNPQNVQGFALTSTGAFPITYTGLSNQLNGSYKLVKRNVSTTQLLLVMYSPVPNFGKPINMTLSLATTGALAQSNFMKFLFFCSMSSCEWNNNVAAMHLVYINNDTRIFAITYNKTR